MGAFPRFVAALFLAVPLAVPVHAAEPDGPDRLITRAEAIGIAVQSKLTERFRETSEVKTEERGGLVEFYTENKAPVWVTEAGLTDEARKAMAEIRNAAAWGLKAADYDLPADAAASALSPEDLAATELKLSFAVLDYARDARGGRLKPNKISANLDPTLRLPDALETMKGAAKADDMSGFLTNFHPHHPQFQALRKMLVEVGGNTSGLKDHGKIVRISDGPVLRPGIRNAQVVQLRQRLGVAQEKDQAANETFDAAVEKAVREFQVSIGLKPDSMVGPNIRRVLNKPAGGGGASAPSSGRRKQILVNMERWRWLPPDLGSAYVRVNVPEFLVRIYRNGQTIHTERVVAGKLRNQTPIFSANMQEVVFNPYWNVPNSIKMEEILPYLRRNTGWTGGTPDILSRHNLYLKYRGKTVDPSSVDWSNVDIRRFHIYQPPGGDNVLGNVKFVFPNRHDVYMHDTPQKNLFNNTVRAESHGCMRVRNPLKMAEVLLGIANGGWSSGRIQASVASSHDQHVRLGAPIPVHITYFTTWVDENGKLQTYGDIYGHDSRMISAMKL